MRVWSWRAWLRAVELEGPAMNRRAIDLCVCGHGTVAHNIRKDGHCVGNSMAAISRVCYCPRFIPAPPPPGAHRGEGKPKEVE